MNTQGQDTDALPRVLPFPGAKQLRTRRLELFSMTRWPLAFEIDIARNNLNYSWEGVAESLAISANPAVKIFGCFLSVLGED